MAIKKYINLAKITMFYNLRKIVMSDFKIINNEIVINGLTESGENVFIKINIEDIIQARNEYIRNHKEYVKNSMAEVVKLLFE